MEVKDGRFKPTSQREAKILSRMTREQDIACMRDPEDAAKATKGEWLSGPDSYNAFCAIERACHAPHTRERPATKEELAVFDMVIKGLAASRLENGSEAEDFSLQASNNGQIENMIRIASFALEDRYVN